MLNTKSNSTLLSTLDIFMIFQQFPLLFSQLQNEFTQMIVDEILNQRHFAFTSEIVLTDDDSQSRVESNSIDLIMFWGTWGGINLK